MTVDGARLASEADKLGGSIHQPGPAEPAELRCGRLTFLPDRREITKDGKPIRLRPKAFALLVFFMRHCGEPVSKGVIAEQVWPKTRLDPRTLYVTIYEIRCAIEDDPKEPVCLVNPKRRGYVLRVSS